MNSAACAEENITRSEDKDSFVVQSIRVSDSKAGAVNNYSFPDTCAAAFCPVITYNFTNTH